MTPKPSFLFDKINECLESRPNLNWVLTQSTNPNVAYILQLGRHGTNMRLTISHPGEDQQPGYADLTLELGPQDFKNIQEFIKANPDFINHPPYQKERGGLLIRTNDPDAPETDNWQKGGALSWAVYVKNPPSEDLYQRMAGWYVDCLETHLQLLQDVVTWNHTRTP